MIPRGCQSVGIDLGTTYSALAYMDAQLTPRIVSDSSGQNVIPSVVFFDDQGIIVGDLALQQSQTHADRVAQFVKVHMGDDWKFQYGEQTHTPESLSAIILKHLLSEAEPQIGPISRAVITVPAYFTEKRRKATQQAGEIAGLTVTGMLNEPMAATLAYGLRHSESSQNVVVYDLGGGTFDVTVVRITPEEICELATCGNRQLGGRDWDSVISEIIAEQFQSVHGFDPRQDPQVAQQLLIESERAKRNLGRIAKVAIPVQADSCSHVAEITKHAFEDRTKSLVQTTRLTTEMALEDAGLEWNDVSRILLVGGSTQMPSIRNMLKDVSGLPLDVSVHPIMAVSLGAAIYAHLLEAGQQPKTISIVDDQPSEDIPTIEPVETLPPVEVTSTAAAPRESFWRTDEDQFDEESRPPAGSNEDEHVDEQKDEHEDEHEDEHDGFDATNVPTIRFVTAHGVGVKTRRSSKWVNTVLIPGNTQVPARVTKQFLTTTQAESGNHINIEITQGDSENIDLVEILGQGRIDGFPTGQPPGQPVQVIMEFDNTGRLHAQAIYENTGQRLDLCIDIAGCLQEQELSDFREQLDQAKFLRVFDPTEIFDGLDENDDDDDDDLDSLADSHLSVE